MRKIKKPLAAALIAAAALSITACSQAENLSASAASVTASNPQTGAASIDALSGKTVQVFSSEAIKVVPDMAQVTFAVITQDGNPQKCQEKNSTDTAKVIEFLKNFGIADTSIQTSGYGLEPMYDWKETGQTIIGYQMRTSITVSDIALDKVGTMLSSSIEAGINSIEGVSYLSSKYDETYKSALKKAVASAKLKAEVIAEASGSSLGDVVYVEEQVTYQNVRYIGMAGDGAAKAEALKSVVVEPGQIGVEAQVKVTYKIK
ncbi:MAG: SIMPL domain-containing protein [Lacrimispora sp.]|uniref:SIMPL domain-containing protein n=1 Tax=Lacrimispora sp. TaxID=2719234 RepID=UPI0039E2507E